MIERRKENTPGKTTKEKETVPGKSIKDKGFKKTQKKEKKDVQSHKETEKAVAVKIGTARHGDAGILGKQGKI